MLSFVRDCSHQYGMPVMKSLSRGSLATTQSIPFSYFGRLLVARVCKASLGSNQLLFEEPWEETQDTTLIKRSSVWQCCY